MYTNFVHQRMGRILPEDTTHCSLLDIFSSPCVLHARDAGRSGLTHQYSEIFIVFISVLFPDLWDFFCQLKGFRKKEKE